MEIVDTSGDTLLGTNRQLVYPGTDCFMLCAAINDQGSIERINEFKNEIKSVNPRAPIILIGTKVDLRATMPNCIAYEDLKQKSLEQGFQGLCETSAKEWQN